MRWLFSLILSLFVVCARAAYDFDDPLAPHTNQAIKFDGEGKRLNSLKSFQSAVRFTESSETYTNLGVCLMRLGTSSQDRETKVSYYHKASAAMSKAKELAVSDSEWEHASSNIRALLQSMDAEHVDQDPATTLDPLDPPKLKKRMKPVLEDRPTKQELDPGFPFRERLVHQKQVPLGIEMPRVSVQDLESGDPKFDRFRDRRDPFILTGGMEGWGALESWPDSWKTSFVERWGDEVTDFYPFNMLSKERQAPYLTRLRRGVEEILVTDPRVENSRFAYDKNAITGRYMHLQLTPKMWLDLEEKGDIDPNRHWHLRSDAWMEECLGYPHSAIAEEYHLKNHWKIILTGSRGAGMFNHSDSLMTSSWHAHVMGSKWWYVCGRLSTGQEVCYEDYLVPGEILYYGLGWYHETQNLETPTMTITDTVTHQHNFARINDQLHATCVENKLRFEYSAELCDALDVCYGSIHKMFRNGKPKSEKRWKPWRTLANKHFIKKAESTQPRDNNYDGRNYITE